MSLNVSITSKRLIRFNRGNLIRSRHVSIIEIINTAENSERAQKKKTKQSSSRIESQHYIQKIFFKKISGVSRVARNVSIKAQQD